MSLTNDELTALVCSPSRLRALTDAELMDALRSGCNDALAILFERHSAWVVETAREKLRNDAEVEATVGRVFADIFRAKDEFDCDRDSFKHWLLKYMESDQGRPFA
jgi:DNA-directed RNA polymerase specialized sigma24 family protein